MGETPWQRGGDGGGEGGGGGGGNWLGDLNDDDGRNRDVCN